VLAPAGQGSGARRFRAGALVVDSATAHPWVWSLLAALATWIAIVAVSGRGVGGTLTAAISIAPYLVIVGIGQMFVITLGNGNIDLSIPYNMSLAAFVAIEVMDGGHRSMALGFAIALGCGLAIAVVNLVGMTVLLIPPIVATLATGLLAQSATTVRASHLSAEVAPSLRHFTVANVGGVSWLAIICAALAVLAAIGLYRTSYGRAVSAIGQSLRAADFAGVPVTRTIVVTYILCAELAAISGVLLGAYVSPSLGIGDPYLLDSIAVVVLGGSLIAGGRSNVPGVWASSIFLILLGTFLNVVHISVAYQNVVKGTLIIAVLALVGTGKEAR
jgi:ribose transport system permease protein